MNVMKKTNADMAWRNGILIAAGVLCVALTGCRKQSPPEEWVRLPAELKVEVARTQDDRQRGLMFRQHLPKNEGMYFVFEQEEQLSFYMRDTRIPLSIAFIRSDGVIESIADMVPLEERSVYSASLVRFALEVNLGWFDDNGIRAGDKVVLDGDRMIFLRRHDG